MFRLAFLGVFQQNKQMNLKKFFPMEVFKATRFKMQFCHEELAPQRADGTIHYGTGQAKGSHFASKMMAHGIPDLSWHFASIRSDDYLFDGGFWHQT